MAKLKDQLCLFNFGLMKRISAMNAGEIWNFLLANQARMEELKPAGRDFPASVYIFGYAHSFENFKRCFDDEVENDFEGLVFSTCIDFCFEGKRIVINQKGAKAFLDRGDSCDAPVSEDFFPPVDDESDVAYHKECFHLLEPVQVESVIKALEENTEDSENNSPEDIESIRKMKKRCERDFDYKVAYIFDV